MKSSTYYDATVYVGETRRSDIKDGLATVALNLEPATIHDCPDS